MRFLLYLNMVAIVVIAGALARLYDGTPLPWAAAPSATQRVDAEPPVAPSPEPRLTPAEIAALQMPLPNPARAPAVEVQAPVPAAPQKLRLLTEGDYAPFNYRDGSGALAGFDIDVARALCAKIEAECSVETRPWSDLLPALKRGDGDAVVASMLIPVPGREMPDLDADVVFTARYYSTPAHFAARRNNIPAAATQGALAGKRIAVQAGSVHLAFLKARFPDVETLTFGSVEAAKNALADGRADLLFGDRNALLRWASQGQGAACCRLVGPDYGDAAYFGDGAGIALRASDSELRDRLDKALAAIIADGTYGRISARYFTDNIY